MRFTNRLFTVKNLDGSAAVSGNVWYDINLPLKKGYPQIEAGPLVIFVHQYSKMGGSGSLMEGLAYRMLQHGVCAVTFDMRGVNKSTGRSSFSGIYEVEDVVAVCNWAFQKLRASNVLLCGSSAGAPIAGSALPRVTNVRAYVGIGYVFGFFASLVFGGHFNAILECSKPKLFIMGSSDAFTSVSCFDSMFEKMAPIKEKFVVDGVGHFDLEGSAYDDLISSLLLEFLRKHLVLNKPENNLAASVEEGEGEVVEGFEDNSSPVLDDSPKTTAVTGLGKLESEFGGVGAGARDLSDPSSSS